MAPAAVVVFAKHLKKVDGNSMKWKASHDCQDSNSLPGKGCCPLCPSKGLHNMTEAKNVIIQKGKRNKFKNIGNECKVIKAINYHNV